MCCGGIALATGAIFCAPKSVPVDTKPTGLVASYGPATLPTKGFWTSMPRAWCAPDSCMDVLSLHKAVPKQFWDLVNRYFVSILTAVTIGSSDNQHYITICIYNVYSWNHTLGDLYKYNRAKEKLEIIDACRKVKTSFCCWIIKESLTTTVEGSYIAVYFWKR